MTTKNFLTQEIYGEFVTMLWGVECGGHLCQLAIPNYYITLIRQLADFLMNSA